MAGLKYLCALALGGYFLFNPDIAHSKDITDVTKGIKECYDKAYVFSTKNVKKRKRDECAFSVVADYAASDFGDKDGNATPDEIRDAVLRVKKVLAEDLESRLNDNDMINQMEKAGKVEKHVVKKDATPVAFSDFKIENGEIKIVNGNYKLKYGKETQKGVSYSVLIIEGADKRFRFHDRGNDERFDTNKDCIGDTAKEFCGEGILKEMVGYVDGQEITGGEYFLEVKKRIVGAYAQYLLKSFDGTGQYHVNAEERNFTYSDGVFGFFVADTNKDGFTDTFVVKKGSIAGREFIIQVDNDDTLRTIIGGMFDTLANKAKPVS